MPEKVNYECLPTIAGPYVHAVKHKDTLYVSGLTAFGTSAQSDPLIAQSEVILAQLAQILKTEKRCKEDLVKLTIFVKYISQLSLIREQLFGFYESFLPACSLVEVSNLIHPDLLIEIEAVVALS